MKRDRGYHQSNRLVCGVGTNDAGYKITLYETTENPDGTKNRVCIWSCPYYARWQHVLKRCYSKKFLQKNPSYRGCYVCDEWLLFSNFKAWMQEQEWEGKELDKDILFQYNKVYSPTTCIFVPSEVNIFIKEGSQNKKKASLLPIGVHIEKSSGKIIAQIHKDGARKRIGFFDTPLLGHKAWLAAKLEIAIELATKQTDSRVSEALINRYVNYKLPDYLLDCLVDQL